MGLCTEGVWAVGGAMQSYMKKPFFRQLCPGGPGDCGGTMNGTMWGAMGEIVKALGVAFKTAGTCVQLQRAG